MSTTTERDTPAWPEPYLLAAREDLRAKSRKLPDDFGLSPDHPVSLNSDTWVLGPAVLARGASLLDESNYLVLLRELNSRHGRDQWCLTRASHFACGWVEHLSFKMYHEGGVNTTPLYEWLRDWFLTLSEHYPCADDAHYSGMQYTAALDHIKYQADRVYAEEVTDALCRQVFSWLWDHEQTELEDRDGYGARPSRDAVKRALEGVLGRSLGCDES